MTRLKELLKLKDDLTQQAITAINSDNLEQLAEAQAEYNRVKAQIAELTLAAAQAQTAEVA